MIEPMILDASLTKKSRSTRLYKRILQELGFLFDLGFYLIHCEDGHFFDWCLIILQGENCQIQFSVDRGSLACFFGPVNGYRAFGVYSHRDWFYIYDVVNFIDQIPFDRYQNHFLDVDSHTYKKDWMGWTLKRFAIALKPRIERILNFFAVEENHTHQLLDYVEDMRRYRNEKDFKKRFSNPSVYYLNNKTKRLFRKRILKFVIALFVCLVLLAFVVLLLYTYQFLKI